MSYTHIRAGHIIHASDGTHKVYASTNKAKQASRDIQIAAGGLGQGSVIVRNKYKGVKHAK